MFRKFGSEQRSNVPVNGYENMPVFISERDMPYPASPTAVMNREQRRRLAREAIRPVEYLDIVVRTPEAPRQLGNSELPIYPYKELIVDTVQNNPVTILVGETGSGKSTQVPQFLYEAGLKVAITQPRRLAAREVSKRMAFEITQVYEDVPLDVVGYHTAEKNEVTDNTCITVLTDGLRLVQEMNDRGELEDEVLIIDEVHEWNANIEILVAWVKKLIIEKPAMRVVIMSATMDAQRLSNYFSDVTEYAPPIIEVPGRLFDLEKLEEPESTVVEQVAKYAEQGKNILVFVAGKQEIYDATKKISSRLSNEILQSATILPLHSKMSDKAQDAVNVQYEGIKIIVATNVAQTSLTIEGVDAVIDSGEERRIEIDEYGVQALVKRPVSQADCRQRGGRAARTKPGTYVLTRGDEEEISFEPFINRPEYPTAEILRSDPQRNALRAAAVGADLAELDLFHPLDERVIERAKRALMTLGALNEDGSITSIGKRMNEFPVSPDCARMVVEADRYSPNTRAYVSAIAASMEVGGLPYYAPNTSSKWTDLTEETNSDLLAQLDMFLAVQELPLHGKVSYHLDIKNVERAQEIHKKITKRANAQEGVLAPPTQAEREDVIRCIYAGMADFVYENAGDDKYVRVEGANKIPRELSNRSFVKGLPHFVIGNPYRVEYMKSGNHLERYIIEKVTKVNPIVFGEIALNLCEWRPIKHELRNGKYIQVQRQFYKGIDFGGIEKRVDAEPSLELRRQIIDHVIENPGPAQKQIRDIKKQIEKLERLELKQSRAVRSDNDEARSRFTQNDLRELIDKATPADVLDPTLIDNNLRLMNITLDGLISQQERQRIYDSAPSELIVDDVRLQLDYQGGQPLVRRFKVAEIQKLREEVYLDDGRQVLFVHSGRRYSLEDLVREV